jgi:hypothetical protein
LEIGGARGGTEGGVEGGMEGGEAGCDVGGETGGDTGEATGAGGGQLGQVPHIGSSDGNIEEKSSKFRGGVGILETHQQVRLLLKLDARRNSCDIAVTELTFQPEID